MPAAKPYPLPEPMHPKLARVHENADRDRAHFEEAALAYLKAGGSPYAPVRPETVFIQAIKKKAFRLIDQLIRQGVSWDPAHHMGVSPLETAVQELTLYAHQTAHERLGLSDAGLTMMGRIVEQALRHTPKPWDHLDPTTLLNQAEWQTYVPWVIAALHRGGPLSEAQASASVMWTLDSLGAANACAEPTLTAIEALWPALDLAGAWQSSRVELDGPNDQGRRRQWGTALHYAVQAAGMAAVPWSTWQSTAWGALFDRLIAYTADHPLTVQSKPSWQPEETLPWETWVHRMQLNLPDGPGRKNLPELLAYVSAKRLEAQLDQTLTPAPTRRPRL